MTEQYVQVPEHSACHDSTPHPPHRWEWGIGDEPDITWVPLICDGIAAETPRIEDMAPRTTFRFGKSDTLWTLYYNATFENFYVVSPDGSVWQAEDIDPSTIRDVTPPKETP